MCENPKDILFIVTNRFGTGALFSVPSHTPMELIEEFVERKYGKDAALTWNVKVREVAMRTDIQDVEGVERMTTKVEEI